ncbi:hypothetical protein BU56_15915 [Escherichia coli O145:H25 str. 07-3858]|nr:hypothetical protein BU56_15915 [Escherichia coli O145:H25 str. 07-3858]
MHPADFSLLAPACEEEQTEIADEEEMLMAESDRSCRRRPVRRGRRARYFTFCRMWWMSARMMLQLMMASAGISGV